MIANKTNTKRSLPVWPNFRKFVCVLLGSARPYVPFLYLFARLLLNCLFNCCIRNVCSENTGALKLQKMAEFVVVMAKEKNFIFCWACISTQLLLMSNWTHFSDCICFTPLHVSSNKCLSSGGSNCFSTSPSITHSGKKWID